MTEQISIRDWERLSAYLDNDLEAGRRETLEQRLRAEPGLQRALERLQATRNVLRRAPQARVPRSFVLSADMVSQRGSWLSRLNLNLSVVSAVASLMLVVVLLGDLFAFGGAVDLTDLPGFAAAAPASDEESLAFSSEIAEESSMADDSMDGEDEDGLPEETQMLPENAGGGLDDFDGDNPEERTMATKEPPTTAFALDPWLALELSLLLIAVLAALGAWQRRSSH